MDLTPTAAKTLISGGRYDAFPNAAVKPDGVTVLATWRSATDHAVDQASSVKAAISTDGGKTFGAPYVAVKNPSSVQATDFSGLVWSEDLQAWLALALIRTYSSAAKTATLTKLDAQIMSSPDGVTWTQRGPASLPWTGMDWFFVSDMALADGLLVVSCYGKTTGGPFGVPVLMVSRDLGLTWGAPVVLPSAAGQDVSEPQIVRAGADWLVLIRTADMNIVQTRSTDLVSWSDATVALGATTGEPEACRTADGTLMMLLREPPVIDGTHGLWGWATSEDDGATWVRRGGFPDSTRYMMYGALVPLPSGDVSCIFCSEDNPAYPWKSSSAYYTRFVVARLQVQVVRRAGYPVGVQIDTSLGGRPIRTWVDAWDGTEYADEVRISASSDGTSWVDYEVQQHRTVTYSVGGRTSPPIRLDELPSAWLVHPIEPSRSVPVAFGEDSDRAYALNADVLWVPMRANAVVTRTGGRGGAQGQTVIRTKTVEDRKRLRRLLSDGNPLFVSQHAGLDFPDWIQPLDLSSARLVQHCERDEREWTLKWVEVDRPAGTALVRRKRIRDVHTRIDATHYTIDSGGADL